MHSPTQLLQFTPHYWETQLVITVTFPVYSWILLSINILFILLCRLLFCINFRKRHVLIVPSCPNSFPSINRVSPPWYCAGNFLWSLLRNKLITYAMNRQKYQRFQVLSGKYEDGCLMSWRSLTAFHRC